MPTPDWLDSAGLHGHLLGHTPAGAQDRLRAARRYAALVSEPHAHDASFWKDALRAQVFLGDEAFVERMQPLAGPQRMSDKQIPKAQRHRLRTWPDCLAQCGDRSHALHMAYRECGVTMTALAKQTGLSVSHVSRLIAAREDAARKGEKGDLTLSLPLS